MGKAKEVPKLGLVETKPTDQLNSLCDSLSILAVDIGKEVSGMKDALFKIQAKKTEILRKLREI